MEIKGNTREIVVISILIVICGILMLVSGFQGINQLVFMISVIDVVASDAAPEELILLKAGDIIFLTIYSIFAALGIAYFLMSYG